MISTDARRILEWYLDMGVDETIGDAPVDRYLVNPEPPKAAAPGPDARQSAATEVDPDLDRNFESRPPQALDGLQTEVSEQRAVRFAEIAAANSGDLESLRKATNDFEHCALKGEATKLVFSDGNPEAKVMIIGEAPGADEDRIGKPFVGRAGKLLDRMFEAIGMSRTAQEPDRALYIANAVPWRPRGNRNPTPEELRVMFPFTAKHIELAKPEILVLMGNVPCSALIGKDRITRLRGNWQDFRGIPVMPMFHPAYLLRNAQSKMYSWWDLIEIRKRLKSVQ